MNKILKTAYAKLWVPIMGRFVSMFIPIFEGKASVTKPTYDIDGEKFKSLK